MKYHVNGTKTQLPAPFLPLVAGEKTQSKSDL